MNKKQYATPLTNVVEMENEDMIALSTGNGLSCDEVGNRNQLKVIADAIVDGLPIYEKNGETIKPNNFADTEPMGKTQIPMAFFIEEPTEDSFQAI